MAQNRAILSQKETLTPAIINSAEKDRLNLIRHGIDQIRLGKEISYRDISDIDSTFWIGRKRAKKNLNLESDQKEYQNESENNEINNSDSAQCLEDGRCTHLNSKEPKDSVNSYNIVKGKEKSIKSRNEFSEVRQSTKNADEFLDL